MGGWTLLHEGVTTIEHDKRDGAYYIRLYDIVVSSCTSTDPAFCLENVYAVSAKALSRDELHLLHKHLLDVVW